MSRTIPRSPRIAPFARAALLLLVVVTSRAHAQYGGSAGGERPVRFGISGGAAVPIGDFKDRFQAGALRRDLQTGVAGQGFLEVRAPGLPIGFRASVTYNRFTVGKVRLGTTGTEVPGAQGSSQILGGLGNLTLHFPSGPIRPYVIGGVGAFNVKNRFTGLASGQTTGVTSEVSETDFGIDGGGGITLRLGAIDAFVEARLANVYTKKERFGNLKSVQYVPVTFGLVF